MTNSVIPARRTFFGYAELVNTHRNPMFISFDNIAFNWIIFQEFRSKKSSALFNAVESAQCSSIKWICAVHAALSWISAPTNRIYIWCEAHTHTLIHTNVVRMHAVKMQPPGVNVCLCVPATQQRNIAHLWTQFAHYLTIFALTPVVHFKHLFSVFAISIINRVSFRCMKTS